MKRIVGCCLLAVLAVAVCTTPPADAQILRRAKEKLKERVDRRAEEAVDRALDRAEEAVTCVVTDEACIAAAEAEGRAVRTVDEAGNEVAPGDAPAADAAEEAAAALRPGEGAWANYDFVPGERILFAEDFSRDRVGNFPQRFELLTGNAEVVEWQGRRWLRANDYTAFRIPLPENLPERFTVEFELLVPWSAMGFYSEAREPYHQFINTNVETSSVLVCGTEVGVYRGGSSGKSTIDPRDTFDMGYEDSRLSDRPFHVRMQVDGSYIKLYLDEKRAANMPNGNFGRLDFLAFEFDHNGEEADAPLVTGFSINAGGSPLYDALMADGRFATQGILFDTGSDRLRPESTPTLKEIGDVLARHADLRLLIEGHTDDVGDAASNQALSEKRAAAVRAYLVERHGVAPDRLEAKGFGASRPAVPNDTPEGRQQNRRVELVRL